MTSSENTTSLKYEKTQNRDIINTIERINNSEKFKPVAERILKEIARIAGEEAKKSMKAIWRNVHESHENPKNLVFNVSIGSPIYRKSGDSFFYTMGVHTMFFADLGESSGNDEYEMSNLKWFSENISQKLNADISKMIKSVTDRESEIAPYFHYTMVDEPRNSGDSKIGRSPKMLKINFVYMSSIRNSHGKDGLMFSDDHTPFNESESLHDGIVSNVALSFARIGESKENS